jgi:hypothetical protein
MRSWAHHTPKITRTLTGAKGGFEKSHHCFRMKSEKDLSCYGKKKVACRN